MTRILPLIPLMLWLIWSDQSSAAGTAAPRVARPINLLPLAWMLIGVLGIVAIMALAARVLLRAYRNSYSAVPTRGFHLGMLGARIAMVAWYGFAVYGLGFGASVDQMLLPIADWQTRLPGLVLGTWPVLLGWFGLWWAAYPIERTSREQNLLIEIDSGLTPRAPPSLFETLASNFRMQVLFMLAPVLAVAVIRDVAAVGFHLAGVPMRDKAEAAIFVASILLVFIASPELLVRVLRARTLAPSPLRDRLEAMARQLGLRYRDILIWHTSHGIGNAAVMGLVPRFRYILLTDLLIETLDDRQIEAVFAHEAGHVKHRHLLWYVVFFAIFILTLFGPGDVLYRQLLRAAHVDELPANLIVMLGVSGLFLMLFGMLARLFEKQADVYAARSIESLRAETMSPPLATPVGSLGAESFVSALTRVAEINHLPHLREGNTRRRRRRNILAAGAGQMLEVAINFLHPSIPDRVDHLRDIAQETRRTARFDKKVVLVMLGMVFVLMTLSTWVVMEQIR